MSERAWFWMWTVLTAIAMGVIGALLTLTLCAMGFPVWFAWIVSFATGWCLGKYSMRGWYEYKAKRKSR